MRSHHRQTLSSFLLGEEKSDSASLTSLLLLVIMFMRNLEPGGVVLLLNVGGCIRSLLYLLIVILESDHYDPDLKFFFITID